MNVFPLHKIPVECFPRTASKEQELLRKLRDFAEPDNGLFLVRHAASNNYSASFLMRGGVDLTGRFLLGRIRRHKTTPGRYEIVIRRAKTCYYRSVYSHKELADELRFLNQDCDAELSDPDSPWISTQDPEFTDLGFQ